MEPAKSFFGMTLGQKMCIPVLIGWPIVVYYFLREEAFLLSVLVFFIVGRVTDCLWPCMLALFGSIVGLSLDPVVKGGSRESQIQETISYYTLGAAVGLILGLMIKHVRLSRQPEVWDVSQRRKSTEAEHCQKHSPSPED